MIVSNCFKENYRYLCFGFLLVVFFVAVTGCEFKGKTAMPLVKANAGGAEHHALWIAHPQKLRIYPSSRFIVADQGPALEVRIEMLDEMGDSVKGAGGMHMELLEAVKQHRDALEKKLYSWDVPLKTIEDQQSYFESVTRTYHFVLRLDEQIPDDFQVTLAISFQREDGLLLQAKATLGAKGVVFNP